jgi:hypothetical protein
VKNESAFSTAKVTAFYSEFDADFKYVTHFKKYYGGEKIRLATTDPLSNLGKLDLPQS